MEKGKRNRIGRTMQIGRVKIDAGEKNINQINGWRKCKVGSEEVEGRQRRKNGVASPIQIIFSLFNLYIESQTAQCAGILFHILSGKGLFTDKGWGTRIFFVFDDPQVGIGEQHHMFDVVFG